MTTLNRLRSRLIQYWLRCHGVQFGKGCTLEAGVAMERGFRDGRKGRIHLGKEVLLLRGVHLYAWGGFIELGARVFIGNHAVVYGQGGVSIGEDSLISMHCRLLSSEHTIPELGTCIKACPDLMKPTQIGRDVWLGAGVTVLGGVQIGDGCVVGAGAVVKQSLPDASIAVGVPARVIGSRKAIKTRLSSV